MAINSEIVNWVWSGIVGSGALAWLYKRNMAYYRIIEEFKLKLPRPQSQARELSKEEKVNMFPSAQYITVLDVSPHEVGTMNEGDLNEFYNKLINFKYAFVVFHKEYKSYTQNLLRLKPKAVNKNFDIVFLQRIIYSDLTPVHPWHIFKNKLKYQYRFSRFFYKLFNKKAR